MKKVFYELYYEMLFYRWLQAADISAVNLALYHADSLYLANPDEFEREKVIGRISEVPQPFFLLVLRLVSSIPTAYGV